MLMRPLAPRMRLLIPYACTNLKKHSCNVWNFDAYDDGSNSIPEYFSILEMNSFLAKLRFITVPLTFSASSIFSSIFSSKRRQRHQCFLPAALQQVSHLHGEPYCICKNMIEKLVNNAFFAAVLQCGRPRIRQCYYFL